MLSECRTFPFFSPCCLSWVVSPIWTVVIWRQNLSFFSTWFCLSWVVSLFELLLSERRTFFIFHLVLSLLGSQSYLSCCYLRAEPSPFFHLVLFLLGSQSYLGCCYLNAEPFLFFTWFCLSWVVVLFGLSLYGGRTFPFFHLVLSLLGSCLIWAVVIWRQNLSLFSTWFCLSWVVVLFGLSLYEGRTFPFFSPGAVSLE